MFYYVVWAVTDVKLVYIYKKKIWNTLMLLLKSIHNQRSQLPPNTSASETNAFS